MISKVKALRDRIFSANATGRPDEEEPDNAYNADQSKLAVISPRPPLRFQANAALHQLKESAREQTGDARDSPRGPGAFAARSKHSAGLTPTSAKARRASLTLREVPSSLESSSSASPSSLGPLPPVTPSSNASFTRAPAPAGVNLSTLLSPPGANGRRKSTPAALDTMLRTAEGKAAVEELLNSGSSKKLMFGTFFAGATAIPAPPTTVREPNQHASPHLAKLNVKPGTLPKLAVPSPLSQPSSISQLRAMGSSGHSRQTARMSQGGCMTVPEDETMDVAMLQRKLERDSSSQRFESISTMLGSNSPPPEPPYQSGHSSPRDPVAHVSSHSPSSLGPQASHATVQAVITPLPMQPPHTSLSTQPPSSDSGQPKAAKLLTLSAALPATMQRKQWCMADYNIVRKMYTGYASTVYQAMCKKSLEMVALKVYHMENLCELNHYQVYREIRVHQGLQHQNIIHLFASFQEGTDVVLVQEYAEGGDLYRQLHKNGGRLSERQAVEMVLHPFLLALHYLHTRGIMHRDVKPENVLFTENRTLKLADFGLAIDLNEERAVTRAGTLDYMAPEVLRCPPKNLPQENKNNPYLHYNNSVDAWAVGVFAYELIVGVPPFAGETQMDSVDKIMNSMPEFPERISELAKDFICQALRKHPGDRPTVLEMLHHPWTRTHQRRTSMRISTQPRRRSSVMAVPAYNPPQEAAVEGVDALPMDMDVGAMSPQQIEAMIRKLQVAKASVEAKSPSSAPQHHHYGH